MADAVQIKTFWLNFVVEAAQAGVHARAGDTAEFRGQIEMLSGKLAAIAPGLSLHSNIQRDVIELIVTANGVLRHFELARAFAMAAPKLSGWRVSALRMAATPPASVVFDKTEVTANQLRMNVVEICGRYGLMMLTSGVVINDYVIFRNQAYRLVMDIIGEDRFGQYVTDVQVMDQADWTNMAPDETTFALADLGRIIPAAKGAERATESQASVPASATNSEVRRVA